MGNLPNFPLRDQLTERPSDGQSSENARNNCVPTSIAAGLSFLTGKAFNGDQLKDAVYGQGYTGVMSASKFVDYCAKQGVKLYAVSASQQGLVTAIHNHVRSGHPVLVTMPSNWGTAPTNPVAPGISTHVGIACGESVGSLRVMNPWGGFWQDGSDAWWQARLCYGQVWPMEKIGAMTLVSGVPSGWSDNGKDTLVAKNGVKVIGGMRGYVLSHPWDPDDVPMGPEESVAQVEVGNPTLAHPGVVQFFKMSGQLSWDGSFAGGASWKTWDGQEEYGLRRALSASQAATRDAQAAAAAQAAADQKNLASVAAQRDALSAELAKAQAALKAAQDAAAAAVKAASDERDAAIKANGDAVALVAALKKLLGL